MPSSIGLRALAGGMSALAGGCSALPSALSPEGPAAEHIARLFWLFTIVSAAVWLLVIIGLAAALLRHRSQEELAAFLALPNRGRDAIAARIIGGSVAVTAAVLVVLTAQSYFTGKSLADLAGRDPLTIEVTGWQWWWEVRYENAGPSRMLITANEIHLPAGAPVLLKLASGDVIHSFWVPKLAGKEDLIPGRENYLRLVARTPGIYRGQCAEFCGLQHAHMGLRVIVDRPEDFDAWYDRELRSAREPASDAARLGRDVFLSHTCVTCHTVRGTDAQGKTGPDLTHIASRVSLAAETLPNTPGGLGGWLADPQRIKPGAKMPSTDLSPAELNAIIAYIEALQ